MKKTLIIVFSLASFLILSACTPDINSDTYSLDSVGAAQIVKYGMIIKTAHVTVKADGGPGTLVGAGVGGVAGSAIGGGVRANILGGIGGALVGGLIGYAIQDSVNTQDAIQYIVQLRNGAAVSVVQGTKNPLHENQCVILLIGDGARARLLADPQCNYKKKVVGIAADKPMTKVTTVTTVTRGH